MPHDSDEKRDITLRNFVRLYNAQPDERRAAIIGFLHLIEDPTQLGADLQVEESGRVRLVLESNPMTLD